MNTASRIYTSLSNQWFEELSKTANHATASRHCDLLLNAIVLLSVEKAEFVDSDCAVHAQRCLNLARTRPMVWGEAIAWQISLDALSRDLPRGLGIDLLGEKLDAPNSSIRAWFLDLGWFVREHLQPRHVLPKLLGNVANTLAYVGESWGLAGAICKSEDILAKEAFLFEPEDFTDQYQDRIERFQNMQIEAFQSNFWKLESECRKLMMETLFYLEEPQLKLSI